VLGRLAFGQKVVDALASAGGAKLDAGLLSGVDTSNAGQAAMRPLASGLTLDKMQVYIYICCIYIYIDRWI